MESPTRHHDMDAREICSVMLFSPAGKLVNSNLKHLLSSELFECNIRDEAQHTWFVIVPVTDYYTSWSL